jgi:uncharacterized protein
VASDSDLDGLVVGQVDVAAVPAAGQLCDAVRSELSAVLAKILILKFPAILHEKMQPSTDIALILFSRSAAAEALSKHWLGSGRKRQNHAVARLLITQAKACVKSAGFETIVYDERLQRGKTFGERLANAFADVFARGFKAAIAVGNDSPQLGQTDWAALGQALSIGQRVLGPTLRGGAYLIGLQADGFDAEAIANLPWQSSNTYNALHTLLVDQSKQERVFTLPMLRDLNTADDLWAYLHQSHDAFSSTLRGLMLNCKREPLHTPNPRHRHIISGIAHRGPPVS